MPHVVRPKFRNHWVREMVYGDVAHRFREAGKIYDEHRYAEQQPTVTCVCGETAFFKPTVGAHVCACGKVKTSQGWR